MERGRFIVPHKDIETGYEIQIEWHNALWDTLNTALRHRPKFPTCSFLFVVTTFSLHLLLYSVFRAPVPNHPVHFGICTHQIFCWAIISSVEICKPVSVHLHWILPMQLITPHSPFRIVTSWMKMAAIWSPVTSWNRQMSHFAPPKMAHGTTFEEIVQVTFVGH